MLRRIALAAITAAVLAGCSLIDDLSRGDPIVEMEVWNQTLDDVALVDDDGRIINVPACGHADAALLRVDRVEIRMDAGRISSFASRGIRGPQFLVVVANGFDSFPTNQRPAALPPCAGHPTVVP
ncbi:MAG TPA: hypothetical protein VIF63_09945 [Candidatus Limnocylindrales bacterium]|jgi:hypothetical protein